MRYCVIIFICLFLIGCNSKKENQTKKEEEVTMNQPLRNETDLKKAILIGGDKDAYYELKIAYLDYSYTEEFLLYAMIMANKYDYPQAYFDVYFFLTQVFSRNIKNIDECSAKLAVEYLLKAYEKGHHQAKDIVEKYSITSNENSKQQIELIFKEQ
jgi:hypothetical protein